MTILIGLKIFILFSAIVGTICLVMQMEKKNPEE
jgi:hypothetical protein